MDLKMVFEIIGWAVLYTFAGFVFSNAMIYIFSKKWGIYFLYVFMFLLNVLFVYLFKFYSK